MSQLHELEVRHELSVMDGRELVDSLHFEDQPLRPVRGPHGLQSRTQ